MIQIERLTKQIRGNALFENASFNLNPREKCGLVGRNGSGKSTLFRLIVGEDKADGGNIQIPQNYKIGYLNQHIHFSQPTILEEALHDLHIQEYQAKKILGGLGITEEQLYEAPSILSGGYQLRLHLAKLLLSEPDCLLMDEPTNYLDIVSINWLVKFLKQWPRELIIISHDREFMDSITTHTLGIHRNKVRKVKGGTNELFTQIVQEEEIHERTRANLDAKRAHEEAFIRRFGAKNTKATQAQSRVKKLAKMPSLEKLAELHNLTFSFNYTPCHSPVFVKAENVEFTYDRPLIDNFNMEIENGDRIAIIGKNGQGKSTLLKLLANELEPKNGSVTKKEQVKKGYFGQTHIDRLHSDHTVEEEIACSNTKLAVAQVRGICGVMMFPQDDAKKKIKMLSGGERSRVLLGKILATPCNILYLDEPTHHLDMESVEALIDALEEFEGTVIIVTHSELILRRLNFNKLVVCSPEGQKYFLGSYEEFLEKEGWGSDKPAAKAEAPKGPNKQKRAELVNERSRILKPHKQKMDTLESDIIKAEKKLQDAQEKMMAITDSSEIATLSKEINTLQKNIETLFAQLEEVSTFYETTFAEYERKLEQI